eukprot:3822240-Pleurochrysis_carterae.AAC.2
MPMSGLIHRRLLCLGRLSRSASNIQNSPSICTCHAARSPSKLECEIVPDRPRPPERRPRHPSPAQSAAQKML